MIFLQILPTVLTLTKAAPAISLYERVALSWRQAMWRHAAASAIEFVPAQLRIPLKSMRIWWARLVIESSISKRWLMDSISRLESADD